MNFKVESIKVKAVDDVEHVVTKVNTESGATITVTIPAENIPAMEALAMDVTREIKKRLREDLRQLELRDESDRGMHSK